MPAYDVIVIGAGNAGLTAACTLQRGGAKTLLLERHNLPGGCATSFVRGRFEFEAALHQLSGVGSEANPSTMRDLFRNVGVADKIQLVEEHEMFRVIVPGQLDLTLPADRDQTINLLDREFPGSRAGVTRFLDLCQEVTFQKYAAIRLAGRPGAQEALQKSNALLHYAFKSTKEVLDEIFVDQRLKFVLAAYWPYIGQPPSSLPFGDMAGLIYSYLEHKPFHIRGGSQTLSMALLDSFHEAGGQSKFNCGASKILIKKGAVTGVRTEHGEEISCSAVISNASTVTTYADLLDAQYFPEAIKKDFRSRRIGVSAFVVYLGLDATPAELGFTASTNIVSLHIDEERIFAGARTLQPAQQVFASCYDVNSIGLSPPGASQVMLITLQYAEPWERLDPAQYAQAKFAYAQSMLDTMGHLCPGVRDVIEELEVATPLTMMRYLGHPGGAFYGFDQDATDGWPIRNAESHVPGLYLAGAWAMAGGFQPTLEAGVRVARRILRNKMEVANV